MYSTKSYTDPPYFHEPLYACVDSKIILIHVYCSFSIQDSMNTLYCEYSNFKEFYNLDIDPYQQYNGIDKLSSHDVAYYQDLLTKLKSCQGLIVILFKKIYLNLI